MAVTSNSTNERVSVKLLKYLLGLACVIMVAQWQKDGEKDKRYEKLRDKYEEKQDMQTATALRVADVSEQLRKGTAYLVKVTNDTSLQRRLDSASHAP